MTEPVSRMMETRTKIIATLGPTSAEEATIGRLIEEGATVFRLNFSHGELDDHARVLANVRAAADAADRPIAVLGDLCGPKIRLDDLDPPEIELDEGDELVISTDPADGADGRVNVNWPEMIREVAPGHRVLIDDGSVRLIVTERRPGALVCRCTTGGPISSRKGVNLPDTELSLPTITDYDRRCVRWAIERDLDYLALSFVRRASDLGQLRAIVGEDRPIHLVAKIERPEALREMDGIVAEADAIMIARGDLGVEMDLARVPIVQKELIARCATAAKPVIVATQMLQSMIVSAQPTRAEAGDVANAIFEQADAVMLSGETAVGRRPAVAVRTMSHIAETVEHYVGDRERSQPISRLLDTREVDAALAQGVWRMAYDLDIKLIAVWSHGGNIARICSKLRPPVPIVALSESPRAVRRMALYFTVHPLRMDVPQSVTDFAPKLDERLLATGLARDGDGILIIGGTVIGETGRSNAIVVHTVGHPA